MENSLYKKTKRLDRLPLLAITTVFVIFMISLFSTQEAHASSTYELEVGDSNKNCEAIDGIWNSTTNTCTPTGNVDLSSVESLTIDSGVMLQLNSGHEIILEIAEDTGAVVTNYGTINSGGTIFIFDNSFQWHGTLSNYGTINNSGDITNYGVFANNGTINNKPSGTIELNTDNYSVGYGVDNGGTITNSGTITLYSDIHNGGTITNSGTIINNGSTIHNDGAITNSGTINNNNAFISNSGMINNSGTINNQGQYSSSINNYGTITNSGTINNHSGSKINNTGTITGLCGGIITNSGTLSGNPIVNECDTTKTAVSPNPSNVGLQFSIIFAGKVTDTNTTSTAPNGTLTWTDGGMGGTFSIGSTNTNKCTLSSISTSASSCKITYKPSPAAVVGTIITINSTYSGDSSHNTSSGTSKLTVARATMTVISPINATITHGTTQIFNATVTDTSSGTKTAPTGKISWASSKSSGKFSVTTCTLVPVNKSQSQCSVTYTAPSTTGTITISGLYGGYGTHATSTGTTKLKVT